jgi:uncharacterized protein YraI
VKVLRGGTAAPVEVCTQNADGRVVFLYEGDVGGATTERLDAQGAGTRIQVQHAGSDNSIAEDGKQGFLDSI